MKVSEERFIVVQLSLGTRTGVVHTFKIYAIDIDIQTETEAETKGMFQIRISVKVFK